MMFQPSSADVDAAERELLDALDQPNADGKRAFADGYWRPLAEAIATAIHEAHASERSADRIRPGHDGRTGTKTVRATIERLAFQRMGFVGMGSAGQMEAIVARVLAEPAPVAHAHSIEKTGMCTECDAAWVLDRAMEEITDDSMPAALVVDATTHRATDDVVVPMLGRAFAVAVDSLHTILATCADQHLSGLEYEAESTLKQINEQLGGDPNRMYRLPNVRSSE